MDSRTKVQIEVSREELGEIVEALYLSAQDDAEHLSEYGLTKEDVKRVKDLAKKIWEIGYGAQDNAIRIPSTCDDQDNGIEDRSRDANVINP